MPTRGKAPLILASASPRRQELLRSAGIHFEVIPSQAEEAFLAGEIAEEHVLRLAPAKAREVAERERGRWVLAADTVVEVQGKILGKPRDPAEAEMMLTRLSGREHRVITGFCLRQFGATAGRESRVTTRVTFKDLSPEEICWYIKTGEPFDKAGAYAIQGNAAFMVREINGSYTNVVGLPLCEVVEALQAMELMAS
ncbi:MAG: Maf family protein [Deltaproteobacteria bacterium]|nr:Maf family protein [Deltaproteobacteria bacterium]